MKFPYVKVECASSTPADRSHGRLPAVRLIEVRASMEYAPDSSRFLAYSAAELVHPTTVAGEASAMALCMGAVARELDAFALRESGA